jgi:hypothetical protein
VLVENHTESSAGLTSTEPTTGVTPCGSTHGNGQALRVDGRLLLGIVTGAGDQVGDDAREDEDDDTDDKRLT